MELYTFKNIADGKWLAGNRRGNYTHISDLLGAGRYESLPAHFDAGRYQKCNRGGVELKEPELYLFKHIRNFAWLQITDCKRGYDHVGYVSMATKFKSFPSEFNSNDYDCYLASTGARCPMSEAKMKSFQDGYDDYKPFVYLHCDQYEFEDDFEPITKEEALHTITDLLKQVLAQKEKQDRYAALFGSW